MRIMAVFLLVLSILPAQRAEIPGRVTQVTLFRGQARVTREIILPARTGTLEVIVPGMPARIQPESLYAEASEGTDVRAVRFRQRAVEEEPRVDVRELDARIGETEESLLAQAAYREVIEKRSVTLDKLEGFVTGTAHGDLARGALDAEALERVVKFGFEQRKAAQDELLKLGREERELKSRLSVLQRQRAELAAASSRTVRETVLFLEKQASGPGTLFLNYIVEGCGWSPTYTLRADVARGVVDVEYSAVIQQITGEDWNGVEFILSTATPALSAVGPGLAPFAVALAPRSPQQQAPQTERAAAEAYQNLALAQRGANIRLQNSVRQADNFDNSWAINNVANDLQTFELNTGRDLLASVKSERAEPEGPSLSYALGVPVSLQSRADQQMVRIARFELASTFYNVATPVLTPQVFREAEMMNNSGIDLLNGPANVYLAGRFVGRAEMSNVAQGEALVMGFGADPRLRTRRELVNKTQQIQGGNRVQSLEVRLTVESFHEQKTIVRLMDRLPYAGAKNDLRVTMGKMSNTLSTDAVYLRTDRPVGILRWDLEVPAGAVGEKATEVTFDFSLEFDRNLTLTNPAGQQPDSYRQDFERLLKKRGAR